MLTIFVHALLGALKCQRDAVWRSRIANAGRLLHGIAPMNFQWLENYRSGVSKHWKIDSQDLRRVTRRGEKASRER
jgi:hypothetical protein